ncbi:MAG: thiamine-phosphate kinase [Planctomycetes bacterium]|nr:thiamine-phosphate kinase [Planctomycetota bacterium]
MSERALIRWIRGRLGKRGGRILVDSGDDAAVVRVDGDAALLKTDAVIDGVHFLSGEAKPEEIGHKAIARSLSDIAAMGCVPTFAVVGMAVPRRATMPFLKRIFLGMNRTARRFDTCIVGGDLSSYDGPLAITVSLLGETRGLRPVTRAGARVGDRVLVTGPLGGSIRGRHLTFTPRVREGLALNRHYDIHAMIDVSDGLVVDLGHVCEESGVAAVLYPDRVPRNRTLEEALYDGEDYELLFTAAPEEADRVARANLGVIIGEVRPGRGVFLNGRRLKPRGWEHRFGGKHVPPHQNLPVNFWCGPEA